MLLGEEDAGGREIDEPGLVLEEGGERGAYSFMCPSCSSTVAKPADRKIIQLLVTAGVNVSDANGVWPKKTEIEPPPLTLDDLIDFHAELDEQGIGGFLA